MKKLLKIIIACLLFVPSYLLANEIKPSLQNIYKLLQEKKFEEGIKTLRILSEKNDILISNDAWMQSRTDIKVTSIGADKLRGNHAVEIFKCIDVI